MRHDAASDPDDGVGGRFEDREFRQRALSETGARMSQEPGVAQLGGQQLDPLGLGEVDIVVAGSCIGEQVGEHLLVDRRVLPQVEPAEVGAEDRHAATHRFHQSVSDRPCAVSMECVDHMVEVGDQFGEIGIRRAVADRCGPGHIDLRIEHAAGVGVQACVHAAQRPAVGLVGSER